MEVHIFKFKLLLMYLFILFCCITLIPQVKNVPRNGHNDFDTVSYIKSRYHGVATFFIK